MAERATLFRIVPSVGRLTAAPVVTIQVLGSTPLTPNPPMDTDGRRKDSGRGGEGVTGAMIRARIRLDGRLAAVCRRFGGRRWRPTVAVVSEMAG